MLNIQPVISVLDTINHSADELQTAFVNLLTECSELSKKEILESEELATVFSHSMKGLDRQRLLGWVTTYSPIRPKFKGNGQFEKLSWSDKYVKQRKALDLPTFNLDHAKADHWAEFEAQRTTKVAKANVENALKTLAREVAREAFETNAMDASIAKAQGTIEQRLKQMVLEAMMTESFDKWATERSADMEAAKRKEASDRASKNSAVVEMIKAHAA